MIPLELLDEARRQQGAVLDALGFGPQTTPSRVAGSWRAVRLLAYQAPRNRQPAILLVPAPIKAHYIWDLAPGASAVARCLAAGLQVYLLAWERPQPGDEALGLGNYADEAIRRCVDAIAAETREPSCFLAGHSLGGTLAAVFASLDPHRVRGLIELEGPIAFGCGAVEAKLADAPALPLLDGTGNVPGTFLDAASVAVDPAAFVVQPWRDLLESRPPSAAHRLHWQVRRWTLDESPMARCLFLQTVEWLYRENRFAEGRLRIGERIAHPRAIRAPILAVVDRRSRLVPPSSIEAYRQLTRAEEVQIVDYEGDVGVLLQHVGVLVGAHAHRCLWPRIVQWIGARWSGR